MPQNSAAAERMVQDILEGARTLVSAPPVDTDPRVGGQMSQHLRATSLPLLFLTLT